MPIEQQDAQLRIASGPEKACFGVSGEMDAWNVDVFRCTIEATPGETGDVHLDMVLHGLDPRLQKVFQVVGRGGTPGLVINANGVHER
jgi:hypothetical protein